MIDVSICRTAEELADLRDAWVTLESHPDTPFYVTHRFVSAWWGSYSHAPGYRLHVVVVRQEGRVVGIGPFALRPEERDGRTVDVLRWASHGDYLSVLHARDKDVAAPETILGLVLDELARIVDDGEVASVHLTGIPSDSEFAWRVRRSQDHHKNLAFLIENPWIDLRGPRVVPSHARKYRNRLQRDHSVTFGVFKGNEHGILERIGVVHRAEKDHLVEQKARAERHSLYEDDRRVDHIRGVFAATDDALTFALIDGGDSASGRVLAYRTVFRHGRRMLSWNSAYLPEFEEYRLGKVLQLQILEHLDVHDLADEFDLGAGRYPWKFEWTPHLRSTYRYLRKAPARPRASTAPTTASVTKESVSEGSTETSGPGAGGAPPAAGDGEQRRAEDSPPWRRMARLAARETVRRLPPALAEPVRTVARTRRLRRQTVVWYVPHPDDETIFMGGAIASLRDCRHVVVLLTRGDASQAIIGISSKLAQPLTLEEFVAARDREFVAAIRHLGVAARDVVRLGLPDGGLTEQAVLEVIRNQARRHRGASHRTMSYLDVHPDHASAGRALREAHRLAVVDEAVFYLPVPQVVDERAPQVDLDERARAAKEAALREYQLWEPDRGRYAVGRRSVSELLTYHRRTPIERSHGPELVEELGTGRVDGPSVS